MPPTITVPIVNTNANISIRYRNILFASKADKEVNTIPISTTYQLCSSFTLENIGITTPTTKPAKDNFDKSKKYPANFSRRVLSRSLDSLLASCCNSQFPIAHFYICENSKSLLIYQLPARFIVPPRAWSVPGACAPCRWRAPSPAHAGGCRPPRPGRSQSGRPAATGAPGRSP